MSKPTKGLTNFLVVAETEDEKQVARVFWGSEAPLRNGFNRENSKRVVDFLAKWSLLLGLNETPSSEEYLLMAEYIFKHFGFLSFPELELARDMAIMDKLECECRCFGRLSVAYIVRVLQAFARHRKETIDKVEAQSTRLRRELAPPEKPASDAEAELMKEMVVSEYNYYQRNKSALDLMGYVWEYVKRTGKFKTTEKIKTEALAFGEKRFKELAYTRIAPESPMSLRMEMEIMGRGAKEAVLGFARIYCLNLFFSTIDLAKFLQTIDASEFQAQAVKPKKTNAA